MTLYYQASQLTIDVCLAFGSSPDRKVGLGETVELSDIQIACQLVHEARQNDLRGNKGERSNGVVARCCYA